jgi:hypothetical protein
MNNQDFDEFLEVWTAANEVYDKSPSDAAIAITFKVLQPYSLDDFKRAVTAYLADPENGQYAPKPADVIKQLTTRLANDGRPEADEAWSIAVQSFDEATTVVMNDEIAQSLEMSMPIYLDGDKVGARMAFRASYEKAIQEARRRQEPVRWFPSIGTDVHGRRAVLEAAVQKGQLPPSVIQTLLPAPLTEEGAAIAGYLSGKVSSLPRDPEIAIRLRKIREAIR